MPLWGATDADESKPKNLTATEKKEVFANASGWVREAGSALSGNDNTSATPEVLVAIGGLTTSIGAADITEYEFITTAFDKSDGGNIDVRVRFNEAVDVTGTPRVSITNGNQGSGSGRGPHLANYLSGTGTNELVFRCTIAAGNAATNANDVLVIGTNALAQNGGSTIKDAGTSTDSTITNSAAIGTAAGSITVTA
tara:strand:+ start:30 stop:617 length:588 start_codon:yes stop_codon:yes gene_type:complete